TLTVTPRRWWRAAAEVLHGKPPLKHVAWTRNFIMKRRRELAIYDGRDWLGKITIAADGEVRAFDRRGKALGTFQNFEAAAAVVRFCGWRGRRRYPVAAGLRVQSQARGSGVKGRRSGGGRSL